MKSSTKRKIGIHYILGKALRGVERIDDARASYETALRLKLDYVDSLMKSGGKSISLKELSLAFAGLNLTYVDLQYGDTDAKRAEVLKQGGITVNRLPAVDTFNDIDGIASLVDACDVIVAISNTTEHLAGALGMRVFLMPPDSAGRFWCWQTVLSDALWYPNVRIFRQP